ncbi:MAG: 5-formyltetrahydrofolate cyclo-ligase [Kordiimonadaceae bacterium]|jgi:5-formyltetrahydrofolate cyclo-ligase|nr:5-formyltetrahydrofolate cyclo-ligase [Kordiimonadaceae bacterium]MBT6032182.1 5-formyltetrahydrofolate cyclo-ligase [Kordiimonadaceae bacterium]
MSVKNNLRQNAMEKRDQLSVNDDGMAARMIAAQIIMLPELDGDLSVVKTVAGYYPIKSELDALTILKVLHAAFFPIALPSIKAKDSPLEFQSWDMKSALIDGPFATKQSSEAFVIPEIIIVPLLAFDLKGARIGYGGGYYDRTIEALRKNNPNLITIGVAYDGQKVDAVPTEEHDQKLDMVVTEKTTYRVG